MNSKEALCSVLVSTMTESEKKEAAEALGIEIEQSADVAEFLAGAANGANYLTIPSLVWSDLQQIINSSSKALAVDEYMLWGRIPSGAKHMARVSKSELEGHLQPKDGDFFTVSYMVEAGKSLLTISKNGPNTEYAGGDGG